ncbi:MULTISPECIES: DUF378 domain-containing protein [Sporosarcina]|jgi:uncharacterized membrane protein YuzA (DUF378 family)|uniref:DUF378 domain-containing protein n=1 Tax=Sporosarcina TaxID=1569 RepID=UPI00078DEB36|nr:MULTISPECIES: DUF378 domain-containing protein [Sporosarcina]AMQ05377.1 DUF378 domain-containing protein [Sporosarcina psychrophila]QNK89220.1 DUF378 domain-containing protein [Sporosarcina sp. resist]
MSKVHKIALALTIIGALNWGVAGIFRFDVVAQFAGGSAEPLARFIYIIIGVSGLINLGLLFNQRQDHDEVIVSVPEKV